MSQRTLLPKFLFLVLALGLVWASPTAAGKISPPAIEHDGACPSGTTPVTRDMPGGERFFSCQRCPDGGGCYPEGPASQWWGAPPVRIAEGRYREGRKQGRWVYSTYSGKAFALVDFNRDRPSGAPPSKCAADQIQGSTLSWPGGKQVPPPESVVVQLYCRRADAPHPIYRSLESFVTDPLHDGHVIEWSPVGERVISDSTFVNGAPEGYVERRHANGTLALRGFFLAGLWDGKRESWHENGNLASEMTWFSGKLDGDWIAYHPNGTLFRFDQYRMGELHGRKEIYDEEGRPTHLNRYADGKQEGWQLQYHKGGSLWTQTFMVDGRRVESRRFHPTGELNAFILYDIDEKPTFEASFLPDGREQARDEASCGRLGGNWIDIASFENHFAMRYCELPPLEAHLACATAGTCAPPCWMDLDAKALSCGLEPPSSDESARRKALPAASRTTARDD